MECTEDLEAFGIEAVGAPFALDGSDRTPTAGEDEINLVLIFVAPIHALGFGGIGSEAVEDEVFPEQATIFGAKVGPAAGEGDEAGV